MNQFAPKLSRQSRILRGRVPMVVNSGRIIVELGCWIVGIALIVVYLGASAGLENQRRQGIELFSEARAASSSISTSISTSIPTSIDTSVDSLAAFENDSLPIAVLRIADVGLEVPVYSDVSELNLSRGAGWIEGTAAPNMGGNMAVAAHRDQYFRPLKDVKVGDTVELESLSGHGEFRVSRIAIVDPDDVSVLDDTPVSTITLVTCYPFYFIGNAPQRYIVQAIAVDQPENASTSDAILFDPPSGETP